ncbi:MAG: hypothetical protein Q9Q40_14490 [Acidobacteriota bacterium]|nr:hypothetical protein [Acidobacteriota bacterium]
MAALAEAGPGGDPPPPPPPPPTDELPVIETRNSDFLEEIALEPRASGPAFALGDAIDLWNGNLHLSLPASPAYSLDGRLSLGMSLGYNSKKARKDRFVAGTQLFHTVMGRSWVGLGWTGHLGRIFKMPVYRGDGEYGERSYFETPTGGLYKFKPNLNKAHPGLNIQYFPDQTCTNWGPPPWCDKVPDSPDCAEDVCLDWNVKPGYYQVTYPDGTVVKLDHYVPATKVDPGGWIENYDLAGWYATSIADVFGNTIQIHYSDDAAAIPGAIDRVWAGDTNAPDAELTMTLWTQADVDAGACPVAARGHLREVHAVGFEGQEVVYKFSYGQKTLVDQQRGELRTAGEQKVIDVAVLKQVDVGPSGGSPLLSTHYRYGVVPSVGFSSASFKALLGRITSPTGAVAEYEYGTSVLGTREVSGGLEDREAIGVVRRVEFPDGLGDSGAPADEPHYTWSWERQFKASACSLSGKESNAITNSFLSSFPDGRETEAKFYGHPCGNNDPDWGSLGTVWKMTVETEPGFQELSCAPSS